MDSSLPNVDSDQLRIVIEVGDDYEPTERVAQAWAEFAEALVEADGEGDEVSGFELPKLTLTPLVYTSLGRGDTKELWNGKDTFPKKFRTDF